MPGSDEGYDYFRTQTDAGESKDLTEYIDPRGIGEHERPEFVKTENAETGELNGVFYAELGDIQDAIDSANANGGGVVKLIPNTAYQLSSELHLKQYVTLDVNGATLEIPSDHNGVFVDNEAKLVDSANDNAYIRVSADAYSSSAVVLDNSRNVRGKYGLGANAGGEAGATVNAHVHGSGSGDDPQSTALLLKCNNDGIGVGVSIDIAAATMGAGLRIRTGPQSPPDHGWVQGCDITVTLLYNIKDIWIQGSGTMNQRITGTIQPASRSDYGILGNGNVGPTFVGDIWDPHHYTQYGLAGGNITYIPVLARLDGQMTADGSEGILGIWNGYENIKWVDYSGPNTMTWEFQDDEIEVIVNANRAFAIGIDGQFRLLGSNRRDLSGENPATSNDIAFHDGSGGFPNGLCFSVGASWYNIRHGGVM